MVFLTPLESRETVGIFVGRKHRIRWDRNCNQSVLRRKSWLGSLEDWIREGRSERRIIEQQGYSDFAKRKRRDGLVWEPLELGADSAQESPCRASDTALLI
jgi:hypothetical protein